LKPSDTFIEKKLEERRIAGVYRTLKPESNPIDFCSNDYLGFARSSILKNKIDEEIKSSGLIANGSTGSRLLAGNSIYIEELEKHIAVFTEAKPGLFLIRGMTQTWAYFHRFPNAVTLLSLMR
jgi:8-amino-7-oxononanoate synthase